MRSESNTLRIDGELNLAIGAEQEGTGDDSAIFEANNIDNFVFQRAFSKKQRKHLKRVFGKTTRSPFVWGVGETANAAWTSTVEQLHRGFWSGENLESVELSIADFAKFNLFETSLLQVACVAYGIAFDELERIPAATIESPLEPLSRQITTVELPLWKAVRVGKDVGVETKVAKDKLETMVADLLDDQGWLEGFAIPDWCKLSASWCRCERLLNVSGKCLGQETANQLKHMTKQLLRSARHDGSLMHSERGGGLNCKAFRKVLSETWANSFSKKCLTSTVDNASRAPSPSSISEWAQVGVLRQNWNRGSNQVGIVFNDGRVHLDIDNGTTLIQGDCTPQLKIDEHPVESTDEIGVSCFLKFVHGEYVELEMEFGSWTLQRQLLFLTNDQLLLVADNVVGNLPARIDYRCRFPIGPNKKIVRETETNEFYLLDDGRYCLVLPLALPEWRNASSTGKIEFEKDGFVLSQNNTGRGISAPLVFDLNPKRSVKPRTWRQLTVAEHMKPVSSDAAVAYRVQIARKQWLFYRTIGEPANRTFLGYNFADDFFVGKISVEGSIKALLEVEQ